MHHSVRNAVAMFLTRGDLWLNWDIGAEYMANQLVDSDWSVNSGNWMWVSSSAFERLLDCSVCINSVLYGKRLEPSGDYIRRYVPELANFEFEYIHEPWKAPINVQRTANCIIGMYSNVHTVLLYIFTRFALFTPMLVLRLIIQAKITLLES